MSFNQKHSKETKELQRESALNRDNSTQRDNLAKLTPEERKAKYGHPGRGGPPKGYKQSDDHKTKHKETIVAMSKEERKDKFGSQNVGRVTSEETKQQQSLSNQGRTFSEEHKANITKAKMGHNHSENTKEKISNTKAEQIITGKGRVGAWFQAIKVSTKKGGRCVFKSSWEVTFAKMLDDDSDVVFFGYEVLRIPYTYKGTRNTIPDFVVQYASGKARVVEVAPERDVMGDPRRRAKMVATNAFVQKLGMTYWWYDGKRIYEFDDIMRKV